MQDGGAQYTGLILDQKVEAMQKEYELQLKGVRAIFKGFLTDLNIDQRESQEVSSHLSKMIALRYRPVSPKRPPQILILGPPGSGRQSQARGIAELFGLVHISVRNLLRVEIKANPETGRITQAAMDRGQMIPDEIIN